MTFTWKPISWLGLRTYGIYLWHVIPVLIFLPAISNANGMEKLVLALITTVLGVAVGAGSYRFIERRFLSMKDRFSSIAPQKAAEAEPTVDLSDGAAPAEVPDSPDQDTSVPQSSASEQPLAGKPTVP